MASLRVCVGPLTFPTWLSTGASTTMTVVSVKTTTARLPREHNSFEASRVLHGLAWHTREMVLSSFAVQCVTAVMHLSLRLCQIPARSALPGPQRTLCHRPLFPILINQPQPYPLAPILQAELSLFSPWLFRL